MITVALILVSLLVLVGLIGLAQLAWQNGPFGFIWFQPAFNMMWELLCLILTTVVKQNE